MRNILKNKFDKLFVRILFSDSCLSLRDNFSFDFHKIQNSRNHKPFILENNKEGFGIGHHEVIRNVIKNAKLSSFLF